MPGRPPVEDWLHGVAENDAPQAQVAWRQEVRLLTEAVLANQPRPITREQILEAYPLKPHELLQDRTDRIFDSLKSLVIDFDKHKKDGESDARLDVWLVDQKGAVTVANLRDLAKPDAKGNEKKQLESRVANTTILLSDELGGLDGNGMLVGSGSKTSNQDIADEWRGEAHERLRFRHRGNQALDAELSDLVPRMRTVLQIQLHDEEDGPDDSLDKMVWYSRSRDFDDESMSFTTEKRQLLDDHLYSAEIYATRFVRALRLPQHLAAAVVMAAKYHDLGKRRKLWQRGIGNDQYDGCDPATAWAKSAKYSPPINRHYRHEFGSLSDVALKADFALHDESTRELILHLIAAHHGRARPHFPTDEAFDPETIEEASANIALDTPIRFSRLQRKYGRWQLGVAGIAGPGRRLSRILTSAQRNGNARRDYRGV